MSLKPINSGHDFQKKAIIKDALINPLTTAQRVTLGNTLGSTHKSLQVYDTDLNQMYVWNGTIWQLLVTGGSAVSEFPFTTVGNETFWTPSAGQLVTLTGKVPFLAFRDTSKMDIIASGTPDNNQIVIPANWATISWNLAASPGEKFSIFYQ